MLSFSFKIKNSTYVSNHKSYESSTFILSLIGNVWPPTGLCFIFLQFKDINVLLQDTSQESLQGEKSKTVEEVDVILEPFGVKETGDQSNKAILQKERHNYIHNDLKSDVPIFKGMGKQKVAYLTQCYVTWHCNLMI